MKKILLILLSISWAWKIYSQPGEALNFDGVNDLVQVPSFSFGNNWTAEVWVDPSTVGSGWYSILGQNHWNNLNGFIIAIYSGTVFAETPQGMHIESSISANAWTHLALTYSNGVFAFYKNGIIAGVQTGTFTNASTPFNMGMRTNNNGIGTADPFQGNIDEVRIWNVTRSQCDILSYMNCEIPTAPGLVANYQFNQGIASGLNTLISTVTDATGNGHTGSLNNFGLLLLSPTSNFIAPGGVVSGFTTASVPSPEINVTGNGVTIADADATPNAADHTDFGTSATRTFVIQNSGSSTLNIGVPVFTGTGASDFSVTVLPSPVIAAAAGTTNFEVTFTPGSPGVKTVTLQLYNSDCSEPVYDFVITATAIAASALEFDGINDYIETGVNLVELGLSDFTIETWIKTGSNDFGIATVQDNNGVWEAGEKNLLLENDGHLSFVGHGCDYIQANTAVAVNDNNWHHIALVWDLQTGVNGIGKIYIDGIDRTASSTYSANTANIGTFRIGTPNYGESALNFAGTMDEFRVWNVARSQCEIQTFMNCEITSTASGLVANYHFNQGVSLFPNPTVTTAINSAGSPDGTVANFSLTGATSNWVTPGSVVSGYTTVSNAVAEINITGNGNNIPDGAATALVSNHTDFGPASTRTFVLQNLGTGALYLNSISITGANASEFTLQQNPSSTISASGTTSFIVTFTPGALGARNATITINSNDCDEAVYDFVITGNGLAGSGLNFDGVNDYIQMPFNAPAWSLGAAFTVETWLKPNSTGIQEIMYAGYGCVVCPYWAMSIGPESTCSGFGNTGRIQFMTILGNFVESNAAPTLGEWTHVAVTNDGAVMKMFVNGVLQTATATVTGSISGVTYLNIGADPGCGLRYPYNGSMDELRIWNRALCAGEIANNMFCEITSTASGLTGNFHFNEGIASGNNSITTLADASGNSNNGTLLNMGLLGASSNWISGTVTPGSFCLPYSDGEINVQGNGISIAAGDVSPSLSDHTDFDLASPTVTRVYTIQNTGTASLGINLPVTISGANASDFTITVQPPNAVAAAGSATFAVTFSPSAEATRSASITISNTDCDEASYIFAVQGAMAGNAFNRDGSDDFISTNVFNTANNNVTLEARVYWDGNTSGIGKVIAYNGNTSTSGYGFFIGASSNSVYLLYGGILSPWAGCTITANQWTTLSMVIESGRMRFYKDGILTSDLDNVGNPYTPTSKFVIGTNDSGTEVFGGSIDEVRLWSVARSQCEIQTFLNCEIPGAATGLVANYHFNQGISGGANSSITSVTDASGNGNHLTISNAALSGSTSNWVSPGAVPAGYTVSASPLVEINLTGNGNTINDGDFTPTISDFTDFGSSLFRTFVIQNTGTGVLNVGVPALTGINAADFTITGAPSSMINGSGTSTFTVSFNPLSLGVKNATVQVLNSDCSEPLYAFAITATAVTGSALNFDGLDDYVETNADITELGQGDFTIETWIKTTATLQGILTCANTNTVWESGEKSFYINSVGYPVFVGWGNNYITGDVAVNDNNWHHVAITWDYTGGTSGTAKVYIDGTDHTGGVSYLAVNNNSGTFKIGKQNYWLVEAPNSFSGSLDELRVWNRSLCLPEIINNMNCEIPSTSNGLMANYHFNQGVAGGINSAVTTLADASGNAFTGTLTNMDLAGSSSNWVIPGSVPSGSSCTIFAAPEIDVTGNSTSIPDGDLTASLSDHTGFDTVCVYGTIVRTYTVLNTGSANLSINALNIAGPAATEFMAGSLSPASPIAPAGSAVFSVTFAPVTPGLKSASINISSTDCDEALYDFVIEGQSNGLPTVAALTTTSQVCPGSSVTLNGSGAATYTWSAGISDGVAFSPGTTSGYTVTGTDIYGCTNQDVLTVTVLPLPLITINNYTICSGESATLTPLGALSYSYSGGSSVVSPVSNTTYSVTGTDVMGCVSAPATSTVEVNPLPTVSVNSGSVCSGSSFTMVGSGAATYSFSPSGPVVTPLATTNFTVTGTSSLGCVSSNIAVSSITVEALPVVSASISSSAICSGATVAVTGNGAGTYTWTGGVLDGAPFTPAASAAFSVTGTNTLTGCTSTNPAFVSIAVNPLPVVSASVSSSAVCIGGITTLNGSGADTYTWTPSATNGIPFTPLANTTYTLAGTNTLTGCTSTNLASVSVTVNPLPVVSAAITNSVICLGGLTTLNGTGANSYTWSPAAANGVAFNPAANTNYSVTGTNTLTGCTSTNLASVSVTVNPLPVVSASVSNSVICAGALTTLNGSGADTYTWSPPASNGIAFSPAASNTYSVTGTNTLSGCTSTVVAVISVTVNPSPVLLTSVTNPVICFGQVTTLNASGADTFTWTPAATNGAPFSPLTTTNYSVTGTNTLTGCTSTNIAAITITVNPLPLISATISNSIICIGGQTTLNGIGANTYTWTPAIADGIAFSPTANATYSVAGTDTLTGCTSTNLASVSVTVYPLPVLTASITNSVICAGGVTTLNGGGADTYTWFPAAVNGSAFSPAANTTYSVTGTNTLTGCSGTNIASISVTVNLLPVVSAAVTNSVLCLGDQTTLNGTGADTYTWNPVAPNGVSFSPLSSTGYTLTGTNTLTGCTSTNLATVSVTVNPLPVVSAAISNSVICMGAQTTLNGGGADTYTWSPAITNATAFGPVVSTTYTVTGTNTLTGCTSTNLATVAVTVNALPVVNSAISNSVICAGDLTTLNGSGADSYTWSPSALNAVPFSPAANTTYTVTGTNTLTGCTSTNLAMVSVTVNMLPVVAASVSSSVICEGSSITVSGTGADTYTWSSGILNATPFTPTANSTYSVTGTDTLSGCTSTNLASITVTVNALPQVNAAISSSVICSGDQTTLNGSGADTYTWLPAGINGVPFTPTANASYTVTGTNTLTGCTSTNLATISVTVESLPIITISKSDTAICMGNTLVLSGLGAASYSWTGGVSNGIAFSPTITSTYSLSGSSIAGCLGSNTAVITVTVNQLPVLIPVATRTVICEGDSVTVSASGADTYTWTGANGNVPFSPTATSVYTVTGTSLNGCSNSGSLGITVNVLPVISVSAADSAVCRLQTTTLTARGAVTYTWSNLSVADFVVISPTATTIYTVMGTDKVGCVNLAQFNLTVKSCGELNVSQVISHVSCTGRNDGRIEITLMNSYATTELDYFWSPGTVCPGHNCSTLTDLPAGTYNLKIKVNYAAGTSTLTDSLEVTPIQILDEQGLCGLTVPNGITPNGDNRNDTWVIDNIDLYPFNAVKIFNRWGQEVYSAKGYDNVTKFWPNSNYLSKTSSTTYFYIIDPGNGVKPMRGWIEVVRD
jgi:gliding motility-associated-like protein